MSTAPLTLLSWNFENNGKKDPARRQAGDELLKSLNPDLVFRQELWDADENGRTVFNAQARALGMHGELGDGSCTAVFINPKRFSVVRDWTQSRGPQFVLPPTALTLRYEEAGPDALPFIAVSYHLNYASPAQRLLEAEWLTTWADKGWTTPDGTRVTLPAVFAGDNNSFPAPGQTGTRRSRNCSPSRTLRTASTARIPARTAPACRTPAPMPLCTRRDSRTWLATGQPPRTAPRPQFPAPWTPATPTGPTAASIAPTPPPNCCPRWTRST